MLKVVALLARKPGMSREDFIHHYETVHAPLARRLLPQMADYKRNYVDLGGAIIGPGTSTPDFDSVTEIWFHSRADLEAMLAPNAIPAIGEEIARDEDKFLNRGKTRFFVVEEHA